MNQPQNMNNSGTKELQTKENTSLIFTVHPSFSNTHHHLLPRLKSVSPFVFLVFLTCIVSELKRIIGPRLKAHYSQSMQNYMRVCREDQQESIHEIMNHEILK